MKKIAVFFKQPNKNDYPLNIEKYLNAYKELGSRIKKSGADFYITRDNSTYLGNGLFSKNWQLKNNEITETGKLTIDMVYDKGEFITDKKVKVLNNEFVNTICTNKYKTYKLFPQFSPKTFLVKNEDEFTKALKELKDEKKVIKPIDGEEGNGVFIGNNKYLRNCKYTFPMLVQEFLDTSDGIPGIYKGVHDLRVVYINGEIIFSFYRIPPTGELISNTSRGGKIVILPKEKIPQQVLEISKVIKENFQNDYYFGVDIGFVKGKAKIIELNSRVGLSPSSRGKDFETFMEKLVEILIK